MHDKIRRTIAHGVERAGKRTGKRFWRSPLVGVASARDPLFPRTREWVSPRHLLPGDLLPGAASVIVFFVPFSTEVVRSNIDGRPASPLWGEAYEETNRLIDTIGRGLADLLGRRNYGGANIAPTGNFREDELISTWSHRHAGYIAGLGTLGINNMLITEKGCCGRLGSLVTDCPLEPTNRPDIEFCLYRLDGSCGVCVDRCVNRSLTLRGYDRFSCYSECRKNAARLPTRQPADVCGKCLVGLPCSLTRPVRVNPEASRGPSKAGSGS